MRSRGHKAVGEDKFVDAMPPIGLRCL
jgi:hypothetical protein